jgi:hypothetical protein
MKTQESSESVRQRPRPVVTPDMALQVLTTALEYVRDSGLRVQIGDRDGGLCVMVVTGATWDSDAQRIRIIGGDAQISTDAQQEG